MDLEAAAELNQPQMEAALHADGPLLVFAGAGSGKTRTIIYRIANLLAEHRVAPYRILAVTFTNKAAGEMRARLERLVGEELARDLWAGTFHAVCSRLLRRYHDEVGLSQKFVIYDDADQKAVVARVLKALNVSDQRIPCRAGCLRGSTRKNARAAGPKTSTSAAVSIRPCSRSMPGISARCSPRARSISRI